MILLVSSEWDVRASRGERSLTTTLCFPQGHLLLMACGQMAPDSQYSALLLTRALQKVVNYIGNRVPFGLSQCSLWGLFTVYNLLYHNVCSENGATSNTSCGLFRDTLCLQIAGEVEN